MCGAALLYAIHFLGFKRSKAVVAALVGVSEATVMARAREFGSTPAASLTLDQLEKMVVWEEEEAELPPCLRERVEDARLEVRKERRRIKERRLEDKLYKWLDRIKQKQREEKEVTRSLRRPEIREDIEKKVERVEETDMAMKEVAIGLEKLGDNISDVELDDDELEEYIMTEEEVAMKTKVWEKANRKYLKEELVRRQDKEEREEEARWRKQRKDDKPGSMQEASSKVDYGVLKSLALTSSQECSVGGRTEDSSIAREAHRPRAVLGMSGGEVWGQSSLGSAVTSQKLVSLARGARGRCRAPNLVTRTHK